MVSDEPLPPPPQQRQTPCPDGEDDAEDDRVAVTLAVGGTALSLGTPLRWSVLRLPRALCATSGAAELTRRLFD